MPTIKSQGFKKQREDKTEYGHSISYWFAASRVSLSAYAVVSRTTSKHNRQSHVEKFKDKKQADEYYSALKSGTLNPFGISQSLDVETYHVIAAEIINKEKTQQSVPHLGLILAVDRLKSNSRDTSMKKYLALSNNCLRILKDHSALPPPKDVKAWRTWSKTCTELLLTISFNKEKVAYDTAKSRIGFFIRALTALADYGHLFTDGDAYALSAAHAISAAKEYRKLHLAKTTKKRETFKPIAASKIRLLLEEEKGIEKRVLLLKTLFGFRPGEAYKLRRKHIFNGKIQLKEIVSKVEDVDIAAVNAPLYLRILCGLEDSLKLKMPPLDKIRLKGDDVCMRRLRTIAACHIYFSTKDINAVKERCGHQTLEMATQHYARYVTDIECSPNQSPEDYYELGEGVWLDASTRLAANETPYDQFLLALVFDYVLPLLKAQSAKVTEIIIAESQATQVQNPSGKRRTLIA